MDYTDTVLLECNRKSAPDYLAGGDKENSHWTNTLGNGVKLEVGDTIQVDSSYISAIGNEASTIEVKGREYEYVNNASQISINASFEEQILDGTDLVHDSDELGTFRWNACMTTKTKILKDNEINLTQSYYKTTNGEYYITLPRHACMNQDLEPFYAKKGTVASNPLNTSSTASSETGNAGPLSTWIQYNSSYNGSVYKPNPFRVASDYSTVSYDKPFVRHDANQPSSVELGIRTECVNDGTKHTLFVRTKFSNNASDLADGYDLNYLRDPALYSYIWYKDTNTYDVNVGFNSPVNVATQITEQMSEIKKIAQTNIMRTKDNEKSMRRINIEFETNSLKLMPCASPPYFMSASITDTAGLFSASGNPSMCYLDPNAADGKHYKPANYTNTLYGYDSNFATIGFKRPEIQETGRLLPADDESKSLSYKLATFLSSDSATKTEIQYPMNVASNKAIDYFNKIGIDLDWNEDNLLAFKKYFEAQGFYEELFDYQNMSASQQVFSHDAPNYPNGSSLINVSTSRFLHMNACELPVHRIYTDSTVNAGIGTSIISVSGTIPADVSRGDKLTGFSEPNAFTVDAGDNYIIDIDRSVSPQTITISLKFAVLIPHGSYFDFSKRILGNDNYFTSTTSASTDCCGIYIDFDESRKDVAEGGIFENELYYGFGYKYVDVNKNEKIGFSVKSFGLSKELFVSDKIIIGNTTVADGDLTLITQNHTREIGFDKHFNAYGTCAILLYNGEANTCGNPYTSSVNTSNVGQASNTFSNYPREVSAWADRQDLEGFEAGKDVKIESKFANPSSDFIKYYRNQIYIGADDPQFSFDDKQSRFFFQQLHTAERVGNLASTTADDVVGDADLIVYKINKRLRFTNYSPNFIPYNRNEMEYVTQNSASVTLQETITTLDKNFVPYSIMDAHSGIQFEDYGVSERFWRKSLWELMGFSYEQFHSSLKNRNARVEPSGLKTKYATTNSVINSADIVNFNVNSFGAIKYDPTGNSAMRWTCMDVIATTPFKTIDKTKVMAGQWYGFANYPPVEQSTSSVKILAENLPRKMISPIYLVKSDVISPEYIGGVEGKNKMAVVSVVPKNSGYGDFYNGGEGAVFTNTIPRTIQNITTTIVDADGSEARVDDASCIIYKITKQIKSTDQVIQDILNPGQNKKNSGQ